MSWRISGSISRTPWSLSIFPAVTTRSRLAKYSVSLPFCDDFLNALRKFYIALIKDLIYLCTKDEIIVWVSSLFHCLILYSDLFLLELHVNPWPKDVRLYLLILEKMKTLLSLIITEILWSLLLYNYRKLILYWMHL